MTPAAASGPALPLAVQSLAVAFGGMPVLRGVDLHLPPGSAAFLLGSNGSGKTTLLNVVSGLVPATEGSIRIGPYDLAGLSPASRASRLVARSFQHPELSDELSVLRHVMLARQKRRSALAMLAPAGDDGAAEAGAVLDEIGLAAVAHLPTRSLSHSQRKLLDVALASASGRPLLLLDEPSAGLDASEKTFLIERLARTRTPATTLIVEHDLDFIAGLGLPIHFLHAGVIACSGSLAAVRATMAQHDVRF